MSSDMLYETHLLHCHHVIMFPGCPPKRGDFVWCTRCNAAAEVREATPVMRPEPILAERKRRGDRITLTDLARHAGVSLGSVHTALRKPEKVSLTLLGKVQAAVEELGYVA